MMSAVENGVRMLSRGRYITYVRGAGYLHGLYREPLKVF